MTSNFITSFFGKESKPKRRRQVINEKKTKSTKSTRTTKPTKTNTSFPQPVGSIKYKDYYFISVKRSKTPGDKSLSSIIFSGSRY